MAIVSSMICLSLGVVRLVAAKPTDWRVMAIVSESASQWKNFKKECSQGVDKDDNKSIIGTYS